MIRRLAATIFVVAACVTTAAADDAFSERPIRGEATQVTPATGGELAATGPSVTRVLLSLAAVGGLIVAVGWAWKKLGGVATRSGGGAAVALVSRTVLTPRHQTMVLRVGHRLVVVGDAGHGMQPLCEITDPDEVLAVLAAAGQAEATVDPIKASAFTSTLDHYESDETPREDEPDHDVAAELGDVKALIDRVRGLTNSPTQPQ